MPARVLVDRAFPRFANVGRVGRVYEFGSQNSTALGEVFIDNVADGSTKKRQRELGENAPRTDT